MAESKWLWPVPYTTNITQYYTGAYADGGHSGIDISDTGVSGKAVVASKSGTVSAIYSGCSNVSGKSTRVSCSSQTGCSCNNTSVIDGVTYCNYGLGNAVYINHGDGTYSQYVHLTSYTVSLGQSVNQGDTIGYVGSTGESTAYHLHFSLSTSNNASGRYNNNPSVIDYIYSVDPSPMGTVYRISNVGASTSALKKCLNIYGSNLTSLYNSINVTLWSEDTSSNEQKWEIAELGGDVQIKSVIDTAYGLNIYRSGNPYNCNIYKIAGNEADATFDILAADSNGYRKVRWTSANGSVVKYLTVGGSADGTNVYWGDVSSSNYQKWLFQFHI